MWWGGKKLRADFRHQHLSVFFWVVPRLPEELAREKIDEGLAQCGWEVQDFRRINLGASRGIAVRGFTLQPGHGTADYLLYVDGRAVGAVEAKPEGATLTGVEVQSDKYAAGLPAGVDAPVRPLPFAYQSTGVETRFTNGLDPQPCSRHVFAFHRPETLASWIEQEPLWMPVIDGKLHPLSQRPASLRGRLTVLPAVREEGLWPAQLTAVRNLEKSFADNRPRALIQMATGSGKTYTAISSIYRLIKEADASRVLFLVDRGNLGRQALKEFQSYRTPDDGRLFTELYNVQRLTSNRLDKVARVNICTIQRMYSMLKGEPEPSEDVDEKSAGGLEGFYKEPVPVEYNAEIPIETFDIVFIDECHRSIYTVWKQVLEYFDAMLVGLTATPSKQTFGFFNRNLVMEYGHEQAVADGVNVDFDVYRIRTEITDKGSKVDAETWVDRRDRDTREVRWAKLDEDLVYSASALDRDVVAIDQIRTVVRTFRDKFLKEVFPERTWVPKTLVFAKDDSHADDIVQIIREEFAKGNDFAQKITYRTTGVSTDDLIQSFRVSPMPRIAVTVDMISTGTDVKPIEIVWFMRQVKSRNLFEQMKGRGVRVIPADDLQSVTPDATEKTRFVVVDCVGVSERELNDTLSLNRDHGVSLPQLMQAVATGNAQPDVVSTLASRLSRLEKRLNAAERDQIARASGGRTLKDITRALVDGIDPDRHVQRARAEQRLGPSDPVPDDALSKARRVEIRAACEVLAHNPDLRALIVEIKRSKDQVIDRVSVDKVTDAQISQEARDRARVLVTSFESYLETNKDEILALQLLYGSRDGTRLTRAAIQQLADAIQAPPRSWTSERLWQAYQTLEARKVRGAPNRVLADIVRLVRFAAEHDELRPPADVARERFANWLAQQENRGRKFTVEQRWWLERIAEYVGANVEMTHEDFELAPFAQRGGLGGAWRVFGTELDTVVRELSEVVAA